MGNLCYVDVVGLLFEGSYFFVIGVGLVGVGLAGDSGGLLVGFGFLLVLF